jgi:hypothetical protein
MILFSLKGLHMRNFCGLILTAGMLSMALVACGGNGQSNMPQTCGAATGAGNTVQVSVGCIQPNASPSPSSNASPLPSASTSPLVVSAPSVVLSLTQAPSQVIMVTERNGTPVTFYVVSANTAVATVSPSSGSGSFTVTEAAPGNTTLTITDPNGNTFFIPIIAQ